ncbi:MAG: glycosyltransferase family 25 protein [Paracoccaceae bacterium]|nr:glycosyltransferase family 25 protein [Paracoccaceae bacterium]
MVHSLRDVGVWLINLEDSVERRCAMRERLDGVGLQYTWFIAVDGSREAEELGPQVDFKAFRRNMGRPALSGDIGCYFSHLGVWRELIDSGYPVGLVLEDDVVFHKEFMNAIRVALSVGDDWDLIRFCAVRSKIPITKKKLLTFRLNAYVGPFTGNAAYMVKTVAARRLLPRLISMTRTHDHELNRFDVHNYRLMGLEPFSCHQDDGGKSTITGERFEFVRKPPWFRRLPYYIQKGGNYWRRWRWLVRNR